MRSANPEQAFIISLILKGASIFVTCPEVVEALYYLRSSICAAALTKIDPTQSTLQVILLTPTDNLARTLYRPLEGYARFCSHTGGQLCVDGVNADGGVLSASAAGVDLTLSTRGRNVQHILVGTPQAVLAHLKSHDQLTSRISMLAMCHAQDVFDNPL
jgi:superfamily II DNA/RNA helicase